MEYQKPHLPHDRQLELLSSRGLKYSDRAGALHTLRTIGYYRLSAYTHVMRRRASDDGDGESRDARLDEFVDGATLEAAVDLHNFDRLLRRTLLDGLAQVEIGLRARVAYELGRTDPFGHTARASLDDRACSKLTKDKDNREVAQFDRWLASYRRNVSDAKHETYVRHFLGKYEGELPIWAAVELLTFGNLLWLLQLLNSRDARRISQPLGFTDPTLLHRYLKALNVLRNHCAHNARVWNRKTTYPPAKPPVRHTPESIGHLRTCDRDRLYPLAALIAHLTTVMDETTNWPREFITVMRKFPQPLEMTAVTTMGFPDSWTNQPLWQHNPPPRATPRRDRLGD